MKPQWAVHAVTTDKWIPMQQQEIRITEHYWLRHLVATVETVVLYMQIELNTKQLHMQKIKLSAYTRAVNSCLINLMFMILH